MPDDFDMLGIPNTRYATTGFGYLGIGICTGCWMPNHMFVDSSFQREFCSKCHKEYGANYDGYPVLIPSPITHSIMSDTSKYCLVCELPEFADDPRYVRVEALLSDKETVIMAHRACTRTPCDQCDTRYANVVNRQWHQIYFIPTAQFNSITSIEGSDYCDSCVDEFWKENDESDYFNCECCDWLTNYNNSGWYNGTRYCVGCIDNNVYNCNNCDQQLWDGNDHDCTEDEDDDSSLIHSYSYKPSPYFFGEGKYHFGFELEVEARGNGRFDGATIAQNTLGGHAYLKEDGSLTDGFEIVTHPHTLEKYHNEFNWGVLDKLKDEGFRSWNTGTCGLHVHISRTAFGEGDPWDRNNRPMRSQLLLKRQSHELRFMKLIYDNQRQVERISGRSSQRYASFQDKGNLVQKVKYGNQGNGRFSAINTENDATIEVRVFRGSLRKERVLSAIEFVHASVEYTRSIKVTSKNHALSWLKFTGYVADNAELYPNLVTIMSESFDRDISTDSDDN